MGLKLQVLLIAYNLDYFVGEHVQCIRFSYTVYQIELYSID